MIQIIQSFIKNNQAAENPSQHPDQLEIDSNILNFMVTLCLLKMRQLGPHDFQMLLATLTAKNNQFMILPIDDQLALDLIINGLKSKKLEEYYFDFLTIFLLYVQDELGQISLQQPANLQKLKNLDLIISKTKELFENSAKLCK